MSDSKIKLSPSSKTLTIMTIIALVFGLLTVYSGGDVLFVDGAGRERAGNYLYVIVWFNFMAGFVYILAAYCLYKQKLIALMLSKAIAISTLIAFIGLLIYVYFGGVYEVRTIGAMVLRFSVWFVILHFASKVIRRA